MNMNTPHNAHPTKSDRTNASAAATKRYRGASFGRLWMIGWLVVAIALVAVSLRKSGEAPEQVATSKSAIQDPAHVDRALTPVSYETAEKKHRSKLIHTFQPIEALRVGDRVIADNPDTETPEATAVDPKTWRLVKLYAEERWPDGTLDTIHIESLQPPVWFELLGAEVGSEVPPPLDLVEMGLPEELRTKVTAIEPCPPIQIGNGRVVLTTVNHLNNDVWELAAVNSAGKLEKLRPTGLHKFYSETRGDWVSTKQIHDNEVIRGRAGPLTIVDSRPLVGTQRVYNLTVEGEHVYFVSELGLLAHNNWCGGRNGVKETGFINRGEFLRKKYAHYTPAQRKARIAELSMGNRVLREGGVPSQYISSALQSFEPGTITTRVAGESDFGLRFYGGVSGPSSPYLSPTFPLGNVRELSAVPPGNTLENLIQYQIRPGTSILEGRVRPAFGQPGGGLQIYVPNFFENLLPVN